MGMYIRDDRVRDMARGLAEKRGTSVTEVVRAALHHEIAADEAKVQERRRAIQAILAKFDAGPDLAPGFTDKDLYDENGDPIL